jgi:hypothetical protein
MLSIISESKQSLENMHEPDKVFVRDLKFVGYKQASSVIVSPQDGVNKKFKMHYPDYKQGDKTLHEYYIYNYVLPTTCQNKKYDISRVCGSLIGASSVWLTFKDGVYGMCPAGTDDVHPFCANPVVIDSTMYRMLDIGVTVFSLAPLQKLNLKFPETDQDVVDPAFLEFDFLYDKPNNVVINKEWTVGQMRTYKYKYDVIHEIKQFPVECDCDGDGCNICNVETKESKDVETNENVETKEPKDVKNVETEPDLKNVKNVETEPDLKNVETKESKDVKTKESKDVETNENVETEPDPKDVKTNENVETEPDLKDVKNVETKDVKNVETKDVKNVETKDVKNVETKESKDVEQHLKNEND